MGVNGPRTTPHSSPMAPQSKAHTNVVRVEGSNHEQQRPGLPIEGRDGKVRGLITVIRTRRQENAQSPQGVCNPDRELE